MDIYLSVNNREQVICLPVLPSEFTVSKPRSNEVFETVSQGELNLIGRSQLKSISWDSFFPSKDYPFLRDRNYTAFGYLYLLDTWYEQKLPMRLIITETPINMACTIESFSYTIKKDGDMYYRHYALGGEVNLMGAVIESAVNWAVGIANDNSHGYDQNSRWGVDYDCSSLVISAFDQAGVKVKTGGATYTGNMKSVFLKYGFSDVTGQINLSSGGGLKRGDVLLNTTHHTALVVTDGGGTIVNASINENGKTKGGKKGDQTGKEIYTRDYYNYPWNCILRYTGDDSVAPTSPSSASGTATQKEYSLSDKYGTGGNTIREDFALNRDEKYKLLADGVDISSYVGGLSWQNTTSELATKMNFEVAKSDTRYVNTYTPQVGSIINLFTNAEIFRGIVIAVDDADETRNKYTVTDFGWYLNKSKETYQFNNMSAYKAIKKVCEDFNIPIDTIPELKTEIKQIYVDKAVSDIISNILELCGGGYNFDVTPQGLRIYKYGDIYAYPEFRITPNTPLIYSPSLRGGVSHSMSIEDMKNSIKVITEADSVYTVQTVLKDTDSIYKFGVLQEVIKIDPEKENAQTVAKNKLSELNKQSETFSFEMIEAVDSYTRAGMVMDIDDVRYLIEGTSHSITNGIHHVKVDLRRWS